MKFSMTVLFSLCMCLCISVPTFAQDDAVEIVDEAPSPDDGDAQDSASDAAAEVTPAPMPAEGVIQGDMGMIQGGMIQGDMGMMQSGVIQGHMGMVPGYIQSDGCGCAPMSSGYPVMDGMSSGAIYNPTPMSVPMDMGMSVPSMPLAAPVAPMMPAAPLYTPPAAPSFVDVQPAPVMSAAPAMSFVDVQPAPVMGGAARSSFRGHGCRNNCCRRPLIQRPIIQRPIFQGCGCRGRLFGGCCR